jgi:hypothetical protein
MSTLMVRQFVAFAVSLLWVAQPPSAQARASAMLTGILRFMDRGGAARARLGDWNWVIEQLGIKQSAIAQSPNRPITVNYGCNFPVAG